jgi:hypothetical protein
MSRKFGGKRGKKEKVWSTWVLRGEELPAGGYWEEVLKIREKIKFVCWQAGSQSDSND